MSESSATIERVDNGYIVRTKTNMCVHRELIFSTLVDALQEIARTVAIFGERVDVIALSAPKDRP